MKSRSAPRSNFKSSKKIVHGAASWRVASTDVEAFVTEDGGQIAPVVFDRKGGRFSPFGIAPWVKESSARSLPVILRVLRGDFFCMPFGGNPALYRGERHPMHGETANKRWKREGVATLDGHTTLHLTLRTKVRPGRVDKYVTVADGQNAIYQRHVISGMSGPMNLGHHAIIKFPDKPGSGLISTSPFRFGQAIVEHMESPEDRGYCALLPGARFSSLDKVPTVFGTDADLSRYPARRGYEDAAILVSDPTLPFAWTAVSFPSEGYVWFALKDPRVLRQTLLWMSNGGRHYPPWSGRHVNTMGLEEITSYFHKGLMGSVNDNPIASAGYPTCVQLDPGHPLNINYIMAAAKIPRGFDHVATIDADSDDRGVTLVSISGKKTRAKIDLAFLNQS